MKVSVAGALALFLGGLAVACGGSPPAGPRPLSDPELGRLARMRLVNHLERSAAFRAVIAAPGRPDALVEGWVDWRQHLVYAHDSAGALVQAVPGLIAARPADRGAAPLPRPDTGWQVRPSGVRRGGTDPVDALCQIMLSLAGDRPDNPQLLRQGSPSWVRADTVAGVRAEVFTGPRPAKATGPGGDLLYWLDRDARLVRMRLPLGRATATVDLTRGATPALRAIDAFGGDRHGARPATPAEIRLAAGARLPARRTTPVSVSVPGDDPEPLHGDGHYDPARHRITLRVTDARGGGEIGADRTGVSVRAIGARHRTGFTWVQRDASGPRRPNLFDLLLRRVLTEPAARPRQVRWIRADRVGSAPVTVLEVLDDRVRGRLWIDSGGTIRRVDVFGADARPAHLDFGTR